MKVYIGPYSRWYSTNDFFNSYLEKVHKKSYWDVDEAEYTRLDRFVNKLCDIFQYVLDHTINLRSQKRKIKVRIDPDDVWSMDETLAHIIHPMLVQLRKDKQGSPFIDDEDVPESIRSTNAPPKENEHDVDDFFHDRWEWALDEMIWAFEKEIDEKWRNTYYETADYEGMRKVEDRIRNGQRLFGKYYHALWN